VLARAAAACCGLRALPLLPPSDIVRNSANTVAIRLSRLIGTSGPYFCNSCTSEGISGLKMVWEERTSPVCVCVREGGRRRVRGREGRRGRLAAASLTAFSKEVVTKKWIAGAIC